MSFLQHLTSCEHFDMWDAEDLLSLLESVLQPLSSLKHFSLALCCYFVWVVRWIRQVIILKFIFSLILVLVPVLHFI